MNNSKDDPNGKLIKNIFDRIRQVGKKPENRTKYILFILLGIVLYLSSYFIKDLNLQSIMVNFSVTFSAVTFIKVLWELVGGEPIEDVIKENDKQIRVDISSAEENVINKIQETHTYIDLINDLVTFNLGINRIWPTRRNFIYDPKMGKKWWIDQIFASKTINILSITLWNNWMQDNEFRNGLINAINEKDSKVQILVYQPGSEIQRERAAAEQETNEEMESEIKRTVRHVQDMKTKLNNKENLTIKYTNKAHHLAQIFCLDSQLIVAFYLHGKDGQESPTFYIKGKNTRFYTIYSGQFTELFRDGIAVPEDLE